MVRVSLTLDDLDLIVKALYSPDIYIDDTPENEQKFYQHIEDLSYRLGLIQKKYEAIKDIDGKIKWNNALFKLGRGFETIGAWQKTQHALYEKRREIMKSKGGSDV